MRQPQTPAEKAGGHTMGQVCLRPGEEKDIFRGKRWIYDNEIAWAGEDCQNGGVAEVIDARGRFVAKGFFNGDSKIVVRVLTRTKDEAVDREFFCRRLAASWAYRQSLGLSQACRVVFGDSDGLPGLTVDKFGDYLTVQVVSLGMEAWLDTIVEILVELIHPLGIYARNDLSVREKEGLPLYTRCLYGQVPGQVQFREHDALMLADLQGGQKTGHFLDQQENRGRIRPYCPGARVLDLCCHTGGFAIHAALYGAKSVEAVDVSQEALNLLQRNAALNGVQVNTVCANVFDLVKAYAGRQYDLVICDPPAFAKSRKALDNAYRGYKELNLRCMQLVAPGGYLATWSCSQFMTPPLFLQMLREAAGDLGRPACLVETMMQSRDHPAELAAESAWYLKGYILQIN